MAKQGVLARPDYLHQSHFFRNQPGAAELRPLTRRESGRVCQRVLMIANMLEGMEHEEAARLAGLSRSAAYEWHNRYEEEGIEGSAGLLRRLTRRCALPHRDLECKIPLHPEIYGDP
jgi:hypothetical protein